MRRGRLTLEAYESGVRAADRTVLAQAITLVESRDDTDGQLAQALLTRLMPHTGAARRVGITGVPGVGKSTLIDALGMQLLAAGKKVAVLAIDPSSSLTGGSILGDKTRMARLSVAPNAFIRPSPSGLTPGGIARRTRETMLLCEAAGFDVVLVETVGVGQGETAVSEMVDFFLVLMLPGAGDELQGIKKGVLELADGIAVNKCDGDNARRARVALAELKAALHYLPRRRLTWATRVEAVSGLTGEGLGAVWQMVEAHRAMLEDTGQLKTLRAEQQRSWLWSLLNERFEAAFRANAQVAAMLPGVEAQVVEGKTTAPLAAEKLFAAFQRQP
ncbi:MAG: methylmalonyl Co-A mutase-associated GTPase MeaB [Myxococcaceae bacterium]|nr:methylmalonyl Co-A mutase-associated GTPase MeaB [Myxococcaceae bacterium]